MTKLTSQCVDWLEDVIPFELSLANNGIYCAFCFGHLVLNVFRWLWPIVFGILLIDSVNSVNTTESSELWTLNTRVGPAAASVIAECRPSTTLRNITFKPRCGCLQNNASYRLLSRLSWLTVIAYLTAAHYHARVITISVVKWCNSLIQRLENEDCWMNVW